MRRAHACHVCVVSEGMNVNPPLVRGSCASSHMARPDIPAQAGSRCNDHLSSAARACARIEKSVGTRTNTGLCRCFCSIALSLLETVDRLTILGPSLGVELPLFGVSIPFGVRLPLDPAAARATADISPLTRPLRCAHRCRINSLCSAMKRLRSSRSERAARAWSALPCFTNV